MKRKVAIVDDSMFLVKILEDFFRSRADYEVVATGSNGAHAVELYRKHRPDLMTLDITMPVKDGKTALMEILAEFPEARILIISAISGSSVLECMRLGARNYVEKPLRFDDGEFRKDFELTLRETFTPRAK